MSETLLVPLDHAGPCVEITQTASHLASRLGDAVVLLGVVHLPEGVKPDTILHTGASDDGKTALQALTEDARRGLERLAQPFTERGVLTRIEVHAGVPAAVIVECAEALGASMIVMGTHGRVGLRRLFLGSVAEQVVRTAPCPVLTVRVHGEDAPTVVQEHVLAESDG
ncbi:MAG TPA: universal stress protein [Deltaproteobacteria bacterium]|nr:universal stress protein [Deltaproteobacteria bacterium]